MTAARWSRVDGGFGWVVVGASFLLHFLLLGTANSFGVLYVALLRIFGASAASTAGLLACFNVMRMLLAPGVSMLAGRLSCRVCVVCGGVVTALALVLSAFATNLLFLYVSFGLLAGAGAALLFTPPYIMIGQYFDNKKGIAMSLGTVGSGLGSVIMAPTFVFLLHEYGYCGCMLLLGALMAHTCIAGMLFRPFEEAPKTSQLEQKPQTYQPPTHKSKNNETKHTSERCSYEANANNYDIAQNGTKSHSNGECQQQISNTESNILLASSKRNDLHPNQPDIKDNNQTQKSTSGIKDTLALFKDSTMVIYCVTIVMLPVANVMVINFVADSAIIVGATDSQAAFIMSLFGAFDVVGRLGLGAIFDIPLFRTRRRMLFAIIGIIDGLIIVACSLMTSYTGFAVVTSVFAVVAGVFHAQRMTIISDFVPKERVAHITGVSIFCQGVGNLIGTPFGGLVRDVSGDYAVAYLVSGLGLSLVSALFLLDYVVKRSVSCTGKPLEVSFNQGSTNKTSI